MSIKLPATKDGQINESKIREIVNKAAYWNYVKNTFAIDISLDKAIID